MMVSYWTLAGSQRGGLTRPRSARRWRVLTGVIPKWTVASQDRRRVTWVRAQESGRPLGPRRTAICSAVNALAVKWIARQRKQVGHDDGWDAVVDGLLAREAVGRPAVLRHLQGTEVPQRVAPVPRVGCRVAEDLGECPRDFGLSPEGGGP